MDFLQFYKKAGYSVGQSRFKEPGSKTDKDQITDGSGLENNTGGVIGLDVDENAQLLDNILKNIMTEKCTLNFVPVFKMASMLDKYVNSNDSHGLETFFDHEVFRKSYHEVRKKLLDTSLLGNCNKSYMEIQTEIEQNLREMVKDFLKF